MADRSLDQQCTVTRPGLSYVSSGFAVEMLINIVSHPLGKYAPTKDDDSQSKKNAYFDEGMGF